jgi:hypothetical protein
MSQSSHQSRKGPQAALLLLWNLRLRAFYGKNKLKGYNIIAFTSEGVSDSVLFVSHRT